MRTDLPETPHDAAATRGAGRSATAARRAGMREPRERPSHGPRTARRRLRGDHLRLLALVIGGAVMLFPFVWMVSTSLTSTDQLFVLPPKLIPDPVDTSAYTRALQDFPMWSWIRNSLLLSAIVTSLQLVTSAMAAYAFARLRFRGREVMFAVYLATLMVPFQVLLVPLFIEVRYLGLLDSFPALFLPEIAMPLGVFLLRQAFLSLPRDLEEAAVVDGAGHVRVFLRIVVPLSKPAMATVAVLAFMGSWNNLLWPLVVINSPTMMTLPLGLSGLAGRWVTDWNLLLAGSTLSVLPILVVYLAAQRYIVQGISMSGLKG